ncbi:MAG TPA: hypothetical protein VI854_01075, partial [Acidimicrobiia bacterium]|nr:hypothetical protein [Acidimicrobiia bacterium]
MSLVKPPVRSALNTLTALTSVLEQDPGLDPAVARAIRDVLADEAAGRPLPPVLEAEYDPVERTVAAFAAGSLSYARDHSDDETFRALTHILLRLALRFPEHARSVMAWSDWDGAAPGEPRVAEA